MRHLAFVPARKGSTGLPGKAMMKIGGQTLVERAIQAARASGVFEEIWVSSDWDEVLEEGRRLGCRAIRRPASLAQGDSVIEDAILHGLDWYSENVCSDPWDSVCLLNPTSPFRDPDDIRKCYGLYGSMHPQGVVSVTEIKPLLMARIRRGKRLIYHPAQFHFRNRQRRKPLLEQNGNIFIVNVGYLREAKRIVGEKVMVYHQPKWQSADIDDVWDYLAAEAWQAELDRCKGKEITSVKPLEAAPAQAAHEGPVAGEILPERRC